LSQSALLVLEVAMFVVSKRRAARLIWRASIPEPAANTVTLFANSDLTEMNVVLTRQIIRSAEGIDERAQPEVKDVCARVEFPAASSEIR
jgi:hypothetical protein